MAPLPALQSLEPSRLPRGCKLRGPEAELHTLRVDAAQLASPLPNGALDFIDESREALDVAENLRRDKLHKAGLVFRFEHPDLLQSLILGFYLEIQEVQ